MNKAQQYYRLWFLIKAFDSLPLNCCYAENVREAKKVLWLKGCFIVPYSALGSKAKLWADGELGSCPLYNRAINEGFSSEDLLLCRPLIPLIRPALV